MKKHLAVLCGIYYPNPSPTGLCAKRFVDLLSDAYDIDVICISDNTESENITVQDGIRIHTLAGRRMSAEKGSTGFRKKALHTLGAIQIKTRYLGNLSWFRACAYKKLSDLHKHHPIDAVLSICSPLAAHFAAMDFKDVHQDVRWCAYTVDPYSAVNRIRPFLYPLKKMIKTERKTLLKSDSLLLSEEVYKTRGELYSGHGNCKPLPYMLPEFSVNESQEKFFRTDDINCVYAGSFYKDIRNPEKMLQTFFLLSDKKIKLHLFSRGCEDVVGKYAEKSKNIIIHPTVPYDKIKAIYNDADVMVGVGNTISDFLPSKVFECISVCKPIVFFNSTGSTNEILDKYPCQWQSTTSNNIKSDSDSLGKFITAYGKSNVSPLDVKKIYEKYSASNISDILHTALEK
ncbi:MAG: hypothetical protein WCX81_01975 [Monoglobales bacterium]